MAASQIPNLNLLRRGRGRGRAGNSGVENPSAAQRSGRDRVVQGTDNDASVSRLSAVELGYLDDPYATALTSPSSATRRFPIINRGTYVRTTAIDQLVARFLGPYSPENQHQKKQIISLGAGSDTRVFRLLASRCPSDVIYHEIDFAVNTSAKIRAIQTTPNLQRALGIDGQSKNVTISVAGDALHTPSYHIHPCDLRSLSANFSLADTLPGVDRRIPTLLLSECCLIYLSPGEADQVVSFFTNHLFGPTQVPPPKDTDGSEQPPSLPAAAPLGLVLYEPIRPDDPFGRTMVSNLAARGIQLQTLNKYASLRAQRERLLEQGFGDGQSAADIDFIWEHWVNDEEKERVARLEMLDEMEEWRLLAQHYCISWGWRNGDNAAAFNGWTTLQAQEGE